jgi:hypothetical protein
MQAAELFAQQVKPPEVARRLRVSVKSTYQWQRLWRQGDADALLSRGPGGSRCRLSPRCLEKLAGYPGQGPAAHGWAGGPGVDGREGGHADRQEVPRLLPRPGRNEVDAPARLHRTDARTRGGDLGGGK